MSAAIAPSSCSCRLAAPHQHPRTNARALTTTPYIELNPCPATANNTRTQTAATPQRRWPMQMMAFAMRPKALPTIKVTQFEYVSCTDVRQRRQNLSIQ